MKQRLRLVLITIYIVLLPIIIYFFRENTLIILCSVFGLIIIGTRYWGFLGAIVTSSIASGIITIDYFLFDTNLNIVYIIVATNILINVLFGIRVLFNDVLMVNEDQLSATIEELEDAREQFSIITRATQDGIIIINNLGLITYWNEAAYYIFGYKADEIINKPWYKLVNERGNYDTFISALEKFHETDDESGIIDRLQLHALAKDGKHIPIEATVSTIKFKNQWSAVVVVKNISERITAEENINRLANYDCLTELPNRARFNEIVEYNITQHEQTKMEFAILIMDLNKFKTVNDSLGHKIGDLLLIEVARRLKSCILGENVIFRFGGDEFAIIISELRERQTINDYVDLIMKQFIKPFEVKGVTIFSSVSIGISIYPQDGQDIITLVRSADMAMYSAKEFGHSKYQFYNSDMHVIEVERLSLHNDLQLALQRKEFILYYQPQIELSTNEVIGIEALLRWKHPEHGLISPFKFIPIAEETGAIIPIGKWVLATVCEQMKKWSQLGFKPIIVAINISMKEFQNANFVDTVISCIKEFGVDARFIELEITESVAMFDVGYVISTLKRLRNIGLRISIDDFGTGFSSLSVLKSLPIDQLKIDRSFIKDINTDERDLAIVETFITLAKKLKLSVVAEGVETEIQKEFLLKSNCDYMQGYLVSYPLPEDKIIDYLKKQ